MLGRMKGSYFFKLMMSHLVLTFALVTLGGGLLLNKTASMMETEMRAGGVQQLTALKDRLERDELAKYNAVLLNRALSTVRVEAESEIQYLMEHGKEGNYYRITRLTQDLKTLSMSLDHLHNLSFWFGKEDFVVDRYFHVSSAMSPQAELLGAAYEAPLHQWFLRTVPTDDPRQVGEPVKVLSYIYSLPYLAQGDRIEGYMIIDLDAKRMIAALGEHLEAGGERLAILDAEGEIIGTSGDWSEAMLAHVREQPSASGDTMIKEGDKVLTFLPASSSAFDWHYALLRPQHAVMLIAPQMKQEIWIGAALFLLLGAGGSYLVSRWCYRPFGYISQRIRAIASGPLRSVGFAGDLGWLHQALGNLDREREAYANSRKAQQWRELVQGQAITGDALHIPEGMQYVALSLRFEPIGEAVLSEAFQYAAVRRGMDAEWIPAGAGDAIAVCWGPAGEPELESRAAACAEEAITGALPHRCAAGMGSVACKPEDVHQSATEAQTARKYAYVFPERGCLAYADVEHREGGLPEFSLESVELVLRGGDRGEIEAALNETEERLRGGAYSAEGVRLTVRQLELHLSRVGMMFDQNGGSSPKRRAASLRDDFEQFRAAGLRISERRHERRNERSERMMEELQAHIESRLQEDVSLDELSAVTGYSKQYICKLFKDELHMTFVDYLTAVRLEHAAELLRTTEEPVRVVAERSGFRSSQYFSTKFKAKYGVTAVQYRKAKGEFQILYNDFKSWNS